MRICIVEGFPFFFRVSAEAENSVDKRHILFNMSRIPLDKQNAVRPESNSA